MNSYINKLEKSKNILHTLSKGINPLDNSICTDEHFLSNERFSKCFLFIEGALEELITLKVEEIEQEKKLNRRRERRARNKNPFKINKDEKYLLRGKLTTEENLFVSHIAKYINETTNMETCTCVSPAQITKGLLELGILTKVRSNKSGTIYKRATKRGKELGIRLVERESREGRRYFALTYNGPIVDYIIDNLEDIIKLSKKKKEDI